MVSFLRSIFLSSFSKLYTNETFGAVLRTPLLVVVFNETIVWIDLHRNLFGRSSTTIGNYQKIKDFVRFELRVYKLPHLRDRQR